MLSALTILLLVSGALTDDLVTEKVLTRLDATGDSEGYFAFIGNESVDAPCIG